MRDEELQVLIVEPVSPMEDFSRAERRDHSVEVMDRLRAQFGLRAGRHPADSSSQEAR